MASTLNSDKYEEVEELVDLRSVWFGLRRRAALFFGVTASVFAALAAYAFLSTELYTAEASMMIEPKTQVFAYGSEVLGQTAADPKMVDTEVELLRSRAMAIRVNNRLRAIGAPSVNAGLAGDADRTDDFFSERLGDIAADLADLQSNRTVVMPDAGDSSDTSLDAIDPAEENGADAVDAELTDDEASDGEASDEASAVDASFVASREHDKASDKTAQLAELSGRADGRQPALLNAAVVQPVASSGAALSTRESDSRAIGRLMKNLEIQRVGSTFLIKIRHSNPSAQAASDIANAYAEEYILQQLEAQYNELRQANKWIDARLATLRQEVRQADAAAALFRAEQGLMDVTGESFSERAVTGIATELATARTALGTATARYDTVRALADSGASYDSISEIINSPIIAELRKQQVELDRRRAELKVRYGDKHPEVMKNREEYTELAQQIAREKRRVVDSLESEVNFAAAQVRTLEANLAAAQGDLASNNDALVRLLELERDLEATRGVYEALLNRQKELNERDQLADANARIIARAEPPESPSKPRKKLILAGGLLLGLILAGASSFTAEAMDTRIRNTHDVRREFGPNAPVVLVPRVQSRLLFRQRRCDDVVRRYIQEEADSSFAESMRDLRMYLKAAQREASEPPSIAFTSVFRGEGTTTTAFAFASLLAAGGNNVAYIEYPSRAAHFFRQSDIRNGSRLGAPDGEPTQLEAIADGDGDASDFAEEGASELVRTSHDTVREARSEIVSAGARDLEVAHRLVAGRTICGVDVMEIDSEHRSYSEFDVPVFDAMIEDIRADFDYIIIDAPSVLGKNEGGIIASAADYTVMVMEWCSTSRGAARAAVQRLMEMRAQLLSFVVTKVDEKQRFYFRPEDRQFYFRKSG